MENKKRIFYTNMFVILLALFTVVIFIASMLDKKSIVSICFALSFIIIFIRYFFDVITTKKISMWVLLLSALSLISTVDGIEVGFNRTIITLSIIFAFELISKDKITQKAKNFIVACFIFATIVLLYLYYFRGYNKMYFGTTHYIDLNFGNPNQAGLWICSVFILLFSVSLSYKNWFLKIGIILFSLLLIPVLQATGSRNAMLACVVCILVASLIVILRLKKMPKWIIFAFAWLPLAALVTYMYLILPNMDRFTEIFSFLDEGQKGLDSRENIWEAALNKIENWALIGDYETYYDANFHNSILTMATNYGIGFSVLLFTFVYKSLCKLQSSKGLLSTFALCIILFTGCFEASVFVGIAGLYMMILLIPLLTDQNNEVKTNG